MKKTYFDDKLKNINKKALNKTKHILVENEYKKQTFDLSLFIGQSYFFNDGAQNLLIFQLILNTFTMPAGLKEISKLCNKK